MAIKKRAASSYARGAEHGSHTHPERWARGSRVGSAVLTEAQVLKIRRQYAEGHGPRSLMRKFGVARSTIHRIVRYRGWRHI